jgi:hypothetical protein
MQKIKWIIREIIYFPYFVILVLFAVIFALIGYRKGINKINKLW